MRITTKGRYALRAVVNMAMACEAGANPVAIKRISAEEEISAEFLEQICFRLKKAGIIRSVRGPGGGFLLARRPEDISLYAIFEAVGEGAEVAPCAPESENRDCHRKDVCCAHPTWLKLSEKFVAILRGYTLKEIMKDSALNTTEARL